MSFLQTMAGKTSKFPCRNAAARTIVLALALACLLRLVAGSVLNAQQPAGDNSISSRIIPFLEQTIAWYRGNNLMLAVAAESGDAVVLGNSRQVADQAARLSFEFARAGADAVSNANGPAQSQNQSANPSGTAALLQMEAKVEKEIRDAQSEQNSVRQKIATATGRKSKELQSQVAELQGELDLANARRDAIRSMAEFVGQADTNGSDATGLHAQINALASSVPGVAENSPETTQDNSTNKQQPTTDSAAADRPSPSGLWDLSSELLALSSKVQTIDNEIGRTKRLESSAKKIREPLIQHLRDLLKQGDELEQAADSANAAQLGQQKQQLDGLTDQFKQLSAAVIPLSKQGVLLDLYLKQVGNWREAVHEHLLRELKIFFIRLVFLGVLLAFMIAGAEAWRRAIFNYVRDTRRRHQLLLLRKFVLWSAIAITVALTFASRLGSIVTFAGLLTAGIAVALQNVILSVVGYFLLIGRFGIRVGDRVQIGNVTGEVIEIGLVRLHLMELGGADADTPTGRIVAFANSVAFQPAAGVFKRIPGTNFAWHEITLTLTSHAQYAAVKERLLAAVEAALTDFRDELKQQHRAMERSFSSVTLDSFKPRAFLRYTLSNPEVVIRFPVDMQHAAEIDERVVSELRKILGSEAELKFSISSAAGPKLADTPEVTAG